MMIVSIYIYNVRGFGYICGYGIMSVFWIIDIVRMFSIEVVGYGGVV